MKKCFAILFCLFILNISNAQPFNSNLASMLQDTLSYYVSAITNVKGMSASVYLPGQGYWQGTAGVSYTGQNITPQMVFGIASNSKLFVSVAILKLVDNNILSLNDSLSKWLPTYPNINPNITIRQLLNHTSGVQDPIFLSPWMDTIKAHPTRVFTPIEVLSWVGAPVFTAGTNWGYSNVNYILAGMVAKKATGLHISKIIRDSILTPLNIDSSFYDVEEASVGVIAHRWFNSIDYNDTSRVGLNSAGGAAGSLFSTSKNMAKWYNALFSGQIISPSSLAKLTTFVNTYGPPYTYGLGLEHQAWWGHTTYGHGGSTWGYKSRMVYDSCMGAAVCGLANSHPAGMDGITLLLHRVLVNHVPGCPGAISGTTTVCQNQNSVNYTTPAIANATSYVWTLPGGATGTSSTNSITVNYGSSAVSGVIKVKGSNSYGVGKETSLSIIVKPTTTGSFTKTICSGQSFLYNGINRTISGSYLDTLVSANGCDSFLTLNLTVNQTSAGSFTKNICTGQSFLFNGINRTTTGTYLDTLVNEKGCDSFLTLNLVVSNFLTSSFTQTICSNKTYSWNGISRNTTGAYKDTFSSSFGCDSIVTLNLTVNLTPNKATTVSNKTISATQAGASYQWINCATSNIIIGATNQSYTSAGNGSYKVIINLNGCTDTSACVNINLNSIEESKGELAFQIYPNPISDMLIIEFSDNIKSKTVDIYNAYGKKIYSEKSRNRKAIHMDMKAFASGFYFVEVDGVVKKIWKNNESD